MNKLSTKLFLTLLGFVMAIMLVWTVSASTENGLVCQETVIQTIPMSPSMIDFYGYTYQAENAYVASKNGVWYLVVWELVDVPCAEEATEEAGNSPSINECLNVDPYLLGLAPSGVFVVDGLEYTYADNLSFFVPTDAIWHWDMWVDGVIVASFEQTEETACHVIEE